MIDSFQITDPDLDDEHTCQIVSDITVSDDSVGLEDVAQNAFITESNPGGSICKIKINFTPLPEMSGHFLFTLQTTDACMYHNDVMSCDVM